jgi:Flp pilus assembly protein TadD
LFFDLAIEYRTNPTNPERILMPSLHDLQPYLSAFTALLSLATLTFVLNLAKAMKDAGEARASVLEERLKKSQEEIARTETWSEREKNRLKEQVEELRNQLNTVGIKTSLEAKDAAEHLAGEKKHSIEARLGSIAALIADKQKAASKLEPSAALQLGIAYMATENWESASHYLQEYTSNVPDDWEAQFTKGVAFANSRSGPATDLAALRSLNEAIALGKETDQLYKTNRPRMFIYRGAILKRLGRLDEAEWNLRFGASLTSDPYEIADATYNLAAVYSLLGDRERLMSTMRAARELADRSYFHSAVVQHLTTYFSAFANESDFKRALDSL